MRAILLSVILIFATAATPAQDSSTELGKGRCSASEEPLIIPSAPKSFLGLKAAPVRIVGTWHRELQEAAAGKLEIKNKSNLTVSAVKIKWFLFRVENVEYSYQPLEVTSKIIMEGETPSIETGEFKPGERVIIQYSMLPCRDIYNALNNDKSDGKPWIEPSVSEILYADGSKWTR